MTGALGALVGWWRGRGGSHSVASHGVPIPFVDRGSFTHGFCPACGWEGPGRRARNVAVEDAQLHGLAGCGGVAEVITEPQHAEVHRS